jgi:hypothetical protein
MPKWKLSEGLLAYFFIVVKVIKGDQNRAFDSFLIFLAKRFNSAYDLLLNTGLWSGGESSGWLTFVGCGGNAPKCRTPEVSAAVRHRYSGN